MCIAVAPHETDHDPTHRPVCGLGLYVGSTMAVSSRFVMLVQVGQDPHRPPPAAAFEYSPASGQLQPAVMQSDPSYPAASYPPQQPGVYPSQQQQGGPYNAPQGHDCGHQSSIGYSLAAFGHVLTWSEAECAACPHAQCPGTWHCHSAAMHKVHSQDSTLLVNPQHPRTCPDAHGVWFQGSAAASDWRAHML